MKYTIVSIDNTREDYKVNINIALQSWSNINVSSVNGNFDEEIRAALIAHGKPKINYYAKVGQLGRWLSFLNNLDAVNDGPLFIVEDDAVLAEGFVDRVNLLLVDVPPDADFFSLFIPRNRPAEVFINGSINPMYDIGHKVITKAHQPYGGVAMFLYPGMKEKIKISIRDNGIQGQFDDEIYRMSRDGYLNGYSVVPNMIDLAWIIGGIPSTVHETKFYNKLLEPQSSSIKEVI